MSCCLISYLLLWLQDYSFALNNGIQYVPFSCVCYLRMCGLCNYLLVVFGVLSEFVARMWQNMSWKVAHVLSLQQSYLVSAVVGMVGKDVHAIGMYSNICEMVCEKGSYSPFNWLPETWLVWHGINLKFVPLTQHYLWKRIMIAR